MARAFSTSQIIATKFELMPWGSAWADAFDRPVTTGVWFIWGNSGNTKTTFLVEMALELSKWFTVFYDSLEEGGNSHTMQQTLIKLGVTGKVDNLTIGNESMAELAQRLSKRKAPRVVFIDSIQYALINFKAFQSLVKKYPRVLFIVNSQAKGKKPRGATAEAIQFDAALKLFVEGGLATSNGRYNPGGQYTIWKQGAAAYWSNIIAN